MTLNEAREAFPIRARVKPLLGPFWTKHQTASVAGYIYVYGARGGPWIIDVYDDEGIPVGEYPPSELELVP
jgi:hypothetical protein